MSYHQKYLKYKKKYLDLKNSLEFSQLGGSKKSTKNSLDIDDISALTESPNEINAYGYELQGGGSINDSDQIVTTTTIEDIIGGGEEVHNSVNSNSSIETSSIEGLDALSSIKDNTVSEKSNDSLTIDKLSEISTVQEGGSDIHYGVILADDKDDDSSSSSSDSLDSDTSDSDY